MSERVYRSSLTAKRIASRKGVLLACAALAAVTDVFVLAVLGAGGFAGVYFVGPSILLAADVLFLLCAVFSNFRFRYSVLWVALYLAVTLAMTVLTIFLNMETALPSSRKRRRSPGSRCMRWCSRRCWLPRCTRQNCARSRAAPSRRCLRRCFWRRPAFTPRSCSATAFSGRGSAAGCAR